MPHIQTQTEWEEEMALKVISFVRNEIYMDLRFFDVALSALQPVSVEGLQAFSTNGIYLYYSMKPVLRIFEKNSKFLDRMYLHTILHCLFSHLWMIGNREKYLWDIACDITIEYIIDTIDKPSTKRALSWTRLKTYEKLKKEELAISAAIIYRILLQTPEEEIILLQREFYTDDHRYWPKKEDSSMQNQQAKENWDKIRKQTQMNQEKRGDDTTKGEQMLATQLKAERSKRSYKEFLQKFSVLKEELQVDPDEFDMTYYSYGLRVFKNMPLIEPLETKEVKKIWEFVIVVDTSYSTNGELVKSFLNETFGILGERDNFFHNSKIRIIQCDDQIRMDEVVSNERELKILLNQFTLIGGGGTDFRPAFTYVNELVKSGEIKNLGGLLYFTDGKGIYPKKRPDYKTAFLFLGDYDKNLVPPWAMALQVEPEEFM